MDYSARSSPTERRLAAAWATVLGIPVDGIGRRDSVFDRGGTSLTAVELAVALDRAVSLTDLVGHPVLAELADGRSQGSPGLPQPRPRPDTRAGAPTCRSGSTVPR